MIGGGIGDGVRVIVIVSLSTMAISSEERGVLSADVPCRLAFRNSARDGGMRMKVGGEF